ncbi:MAG TPA: DEAD/DEAH box helicase [Spirochaetia bacterium]
MNTGNPSSALALFDPLVADWFRRSIGAPTPVQEEAWPVIARGEHALISAPTGTGKTLAAFLWALNGLLTGTIPAQGVRVLYVSPLKALNNDIHANLLTPLAALESVFRGAGRPFPGIAVATRSGDTPSSERQRMARHPPQILITTPESLNLIVASPRARLFLGTVGTVILDEIHAVAGTKRGTHLITAVDRIVPLAGDFQRIALSATVKPLAAVADFVGGFVAERDGEAVRYRRRAVRVVSSPLAKEYRLRVSFPEPEPGRVTNEPVFDALARECRRIIARNRSTLFFVNSRRHAEKLVRFINEGSPEPLAWSHHGSLSRELRMVVEQRLKRGELRAIVATSSLELGIDIGSLDEVILVQTPFSVASAIQRLGRAGHTVGAASSGVLFPLHGKDIVDAAVMAGAVREQDINELAVVESPLDVLAQLIVSMAGTETWRVDEMYDFIRTSSPYNGLPRRQFDLVLDMLAGRYADARLRALSPLVSWDRVDGTVMATGAARMRLMTGGGTIPDRGNFSLRVAGSGALIGELDEEFVWERSLGDGFIFGGQAWRIQKIDHQNVEVVPTESRIGMSPFWKAEERGRDFRFSDRIARALEAWDGRVRRDDFPVTVADELCMDRSAAEAMTGFLRRQQEATHSGLPHRHRVVVEHTRDPDAGGDHAVIVIHTLWGGKVNRPFALALAAALTDRLGEAPQITQGEDAILLLVPDDIPGRDLLSLVRPDALESLLRRRLEGSGFFGARFRESAGRALLLPRAGGRTRVPFWLTRQRARALYAAVSRYDDFPLLLEAWRTCLRDEMDLPSLRMLLDEVATGRIAVEDVVTVAPSPFCGELTWKQTNVLMYTDDTPPGAGGTSLRPDLVREVALSSDLRPRIDPSLASALRSKLQRTAEGYAPRDTRELLDWVKERVAIPHDQWSELMAACRRDAGPGAEEIVGGLAGKIVERSFGAGAPVVVAAESVSRIEHALGEEGADELAALVAEWMRFEGPVAPSVPAAVFGLSRDSIDTVIEQLVEDETLVVDRLLAGSEDLLACDRENLERLLRIARARARPAVVTRPLADLPRFVAERQGLTRRGEGPGDLPRVMETLLGCPLPAHLWEEEALPARLKGYQGRWLDELLAGTDLTWLGCGTRRLTFCFGADVELFVETRTVPPDAAALFPGAVGRFSFWDIADHARASGVEGGSRAAADRLWDLAWAGGATSDGLAPIRRGIASGFRSEEPSREAPRHRRSFDRWQAGRPAAGLWRLVAPSGPPGDALEEEEIARDRIRQLLTRYGVLFREMLVNELAPLRWQRIFRSLRLMELSGELVTGRFFDGIPGLQFALPSIVEEPATVGDEAVVWWINAADPASLCGIDLEGLKGTLPPRLPTTHLVWEGSALVLVSRRRGKELDIRVPPDAPRLPDYLGFLRDITGREQRAPASVRVETINGEPATGSPWRPRLLSLGFIDDYRGLTWEARP